ncbi:hypothetical protein BX659_104106 [Orenia metallireducens]|uniref:Zinc-ribbon domain-containing protein n=1 Tax=Orenia metallireducens TaxID=1413210 RepID=A0A285GEQ8_9FIRM|nr:hypothetical protein [Orenia metallireducens]PRX32557.1 hypothetical protein BX659_104106 [Orenia metallireducens]SNY20851.1 hypothetical protein SAMN06265827_10642 [Orenia metallireducens]
MKIKCRYCGEINSSSQEYCQKCSGKLFENYRGRSIIEYNPIYSGIIQVLPWL